MAFYTKWPRLNGNDAAINCVAQRQFFVAIILGENLDRLLGWFLKAKIKRETVTEVGNPVDALKRFPV